MVREIVVSLYLFIFRIIFNTFSLLPQKKKTVCVASFGDNIFYTTRSLSSLSDEPIIILKDRSCHYPFDQSNGKILQFDLRHPYAFFQSVYHLATATTILIDNYFGFLAAADFRKNTTCIQLWHAAGALKQFGLMDSSIENRSKRANDRFRKVYEKFDYTITGSEKMAAIFQNSFRISDDSIVRTGIPRTDVLFQRNKQQIYQQFADRFPINNRKIILYAPTFRDDQLTDYQLAPDFKQLYHELSDEYVLFTRIHPAVNYEFNEMYSGFVFDVSDFHDINQLLLITDLLITDYSSIPFEFALLDKPIIFFPYDLEKYQYSRGLINYYTDQIPGPIVYNTKELVEAVQQHHFDKNRLRSFAAEWNEYSTGDSSLQLAKFITGAESEDEEEKETVLG